MEAAVMRAAVREASGQIAFTSNQERPTAADLHSTEVLVRVRACALTDLDLRVSALLRAVKQCAPAAGDAADGAQGRAGAERARWWADLYGMASRADGGPPSSTHGTAAGHAAPRRCTRNAAGYYFAGVVEAVGDEVLDFALGDHVLGCSPPDLGGACCDYVAVHEWSLIGKPAAISFEKACAALRPGVLALSALHYKMRLVQGDWIAVTQPHTMSGRAALHMAKGWGAKTIAVCTGENSSIPQVDASVTMDAEGKWTHRMMDITGGLGVDHVLCIPPAGMLRSTTDASGTGQTNAQGGAGACMYAQLPHMEWAQWLRVLAPMGSFVSLARVEMTPSECEQLLLKSITVGFVDEQTWLLASSQQGRLLHMLHRVVEKVGDNTLPLPPPNVFAIERAGEGYEALCGDGEAVLIRFV